MGKELICGIYRLCAGDKVYVGQSTDINKRVGAHIRALQAGTHFNKGLQEAFDCYEGVAVDILEECSVERLDAAEERHIASEIARLGRDRVANVITVIEPHPMRDPELRARASAALARSFVLLSPEGEQVSGTNVTAFCKENDLKQPLITMVLNGTIHSYKGWRAGESNVTPRSASGRPSKEYTFRSPIGDLVRVRSLRQFCREQGLPYMSMRALVDGSAQTRNGWSMVNDLTEN